MSLVGGGGVRFEHGPPQIPTAAALPPGTAALPGTAARPVTAKGVAARGRDGHFAAGARRVAFGSPGQAGRAVCGQGACGICFDAASEDLVVFRCRAHQYCAECAMRAAIGILQGHVSPAALPPP